MVSRAEIARRLWNDYLKVEYYQLSGLAQDEWNPELASHSLPKYDENGDRVNHKNVYYDETYAGNKARDDHYAVRTYILDTETMGAQLVDGKLPDKAVFGEIKSTGKLPQGITLVGRIMGVLGYTRGTNNLGETYFSLNSPTGERKRNMFADAVHFNPPADAPELPKQFVSQIHVNDLKKTHPKLGSYIEEMIRATPDPMQGLEYVMEKLYNDLEITEVNAVKFLEAAAESIKERPWKLPIENASADDWDNEVDKLEAILAEHENDPTEASQYAVWTIFNGLRVNHEAFLTGNIWDTMLCHIIDGRKVIDPAGTEKTHLVDGVEFGGLLQAAVSAIPREFRFECKDGREFIFKGEGPFVEYIERTVIKEDGKWQRINDAFLPTNAKQVFQSTMPKTREAQSWADEMRKKFEETPQDLLKECEAKGWMKSFEKLQKIISA